MKQDAAVYMELPEGKMVVYETENRAYLIKKAKILLNKAEKYGATKIDEFRQDDKNEFKNSRKAIGIVQDRYEAVQAAFQQDLGFEEQHKCQLRGCGEGEV